MLEHDLGDERACLKVAAPLELEDVALGADDDSLVYGSAQQTASNARARPSCGRAAPFPRGTMRARPTCALRISARNHGERSCYWSKDGERKYRDKLKPPPDNWVHLRFQFDYRWISIRQSDPPLVAQALVASLKSISGRDHHPASAPALFDQ
jgi:hypothetical protein